jgi:hypothetical protein
MLVLIQKAQSVGLPEMPSSDRRPGKRMSGKRRENQLEIGLK